MAAIESFYDVIRRQGVTRRSFTKFLQPDRRQSRHGSNRRREDRQCARNQGTHAVFWMHGLECTCCSGKLHRSAHPLVKDVVLSMISLDYDDTIMAAAGHQAEAILQETKDKYKGKIIFSPSRAIRRS